MSLCFWTSEGLKSFGVCSLGDQREDRSVVPGFSSAAPAGQPWERFHPCLLTPTTQLPREDLPLNQVQGVCPMTVKESSRPGSCGEAAEPCVDWSLDGQQGLQPSCSRSSSPPRTILKSSWKTASLLHRPMFHTINYYMEMK